jgi:hypothetical protein
LLSPRTFVVLAALVVAIPCGWLLGVGAAELLLGRDFGVFPVITIPLGLIAAVTFALMSRINPGVRLAVLAAGSVVLFLVL